MGATAPSRHTDPSLAGLIDSLHALRVLGARREGVGGAGLEIRAADGGPAEAMLAAIPRHGAILVGGAGAEAMPRGLPAQLQAAQGRGALPALAAGAGRAVRVDGTGCPAEPVGMAGAARACTVAIPFAGLAICPGPLADPTLAMLTG
jgi:hypothetical protein